MKINSGTTYYVTKTNDKDKRIPLTEEDIIKTLIKEFEQKFSKTPIKLYLNPEMATDTFPGLEVVKTKMIMPNNYHLSALE